MVAKAASMVAMAPLSIESSTSASFEYKLHVRANSQSYRRDRILFERHETG
jgi:hypothetical protein